ncbi:MAG: CDP-alcohol phosphatidyltransferase family protein [Pseudomonadota bacterium]
MTTTAPLSGIILGGNATRLWGMSAGERLRRGLLRVGVTTVLDEAAPRPDQGSVLLVNNHWVFDEPLLTALAKTGNTLLLDADSGRVVAANVPAADAGHVAAVIEAGSGLEALPAHLKRSDIAGIVGSFNNALRKKELPYLLKLTPETRAAVERRMFQASYKGVTDVVTKYWWPRPAEVVTRWCAEREFSPNQVTFVGFLFVLVSFWAFWQGHYGLGLASGWAMTFLDTVDGKLARCTLTSSAWGNVFDHGIDLIHPPFWWWAWVVGLTAYGAALPSDETQLVLIVILGGYVLQRILEGIFMRSFGMHVHVWRRFDSFFRLITARRNPNLIILTLAALAGEPDDGIVWVAIWTFLCLIVHAVQIVQGLWARRRGPLKSWLSQ